MGEFIVFPVGALGGGLTAGRTDPQGVKGTVPVQGPQQMSVSVAASLSHPPGAEPNVYRFLGN